jgi:hypothetical protein
MDSEPTKRKASYNRVPTRPPEKGAIMGHHSQYWLENLYKQDHDVN